MPESAMEPSRDQDTAVSLVGVPFDQQWDLLKPIIERLYIHEQLKLSEVIVTIKERYGFDAA